MDGNSSQHQVSTKATYLFLVVHVVLSDDVLNLVDGIVCLVFCKGALLFEQSKIERSCAAIFLMKNLQIVAT